MNKALRNRWKENRLPLKKMKMDREIEMILERAVNGPDLIQACRDVQLYGLLLEGPAAENLEQAMEDVLNSEAFKLATQPGTKAENSEVEEDAR